MVDGFLALAASFFLSPQHRLRKRVNSIAGFVGMRASEILSIRTGAIEYRQLGTTGVSQAYLVGRLFKTAEEGGRLERWLAPDPVVTAVKVLESERAVARSLGPQRTLPDAQHAIRPGGGHHQHAPQ